MNKYLGMVLTMLVCLVSVGASAQAPAGTQQYVTQRGDYLRGTGNHHHSTGVHPDGTPVDGLLDRIGLTLREFRAISSANARAAHHPCAQRAADRTCVRRQPYWKLAIGRRVFIPNTVPGVTTDAAATRVTEATAAMEQRARTLESQVQAITAERDTLRSQNATLARQVSERASVRPTAPAGNNSQLLAALTAEREALAAAQRLNATLRENSTSAERRANDLARDAEVLQESTNRAERAAQAARNEADEKREWNTIFKIIGIILIMAVCGLLYLLFFWKPLPKETSQRLPDAERRKVEQIGKENGELRHKLEQAEERLATIALAAKNTPGHDPSKDLSTNVANLLGALAIDSENLKRMRQQALEIREILKKHDNSAKPISLNDLVQEAADENERRTNDALLIIAALNGCAAGKQGATVAERVANLAKAFEAAGGDQKFEVRLQAAQILVEKTEKNLETERAYGKQAMGQLREACREADDLKAFIARTGVLLEKAGIPNNRPLETRVGELINRCEDAIQVLTDHGLEKFVRMGTVAPPPSSNRPAATPPPPAASPTPDPNGATPKPPSTKPPALSASGERRAVSLGKVTDDAALKAEVARMSGNPPAPAPTSTKGFDGPTSKFSDPQAAALLKQSGPNADPAADPNAAADPGELPKGKTNPFAARIDPATGAVLPGSGGAGGSGLLNLIPVGGPAPTAGNGAPPATPTHVVGRAKDTARGIGAVQRTVPVGAPDPDQAATVPRIPAPGLPATVAEDDGNGGKRLSLLDATALATAVARAPSSMPPGANGNGSRDDDPEPTERGRLLDPDRPPPACDKCGSATLPAILQNGVGYQCTADTCRHTMLEAESFPLCDTCGHPTLKNGAGYKCLNCGSLMDAQTAARPSSLPGSQPGVAADSKA